MLEVRHFSLFKWSDTYDGLLGLLGSIPQFLTDWSLAGKVTEVRLIYDLFAALSYTCRSLQDVPSFVEYINTKMETGGTGYDPTTKCKVITLKL
jgi:hypothetical protein